MAAPFFDDILFPTDISFRSPGGPRYANKTVELPSGWDVVDIKRATPIYGWDVGYGARKANKLYDLYQLFLVTRGGAYRFLFKWPQDFKSCHGDHRIQPVTALDQVIGTATAGQTQFQLIKTYTVGSLDLVRIIYKPKAGTLKVSVNGSEELAGWTMNATTGIITRSVPLAGGEVIRAGYEFYFPVKFGSDEYSTSYIHWQIGNVDIEVREVRLTA